MRSPQTSYFTHGVTLAYRVYGNGPVPVLAFHGFGRAGTDFAVLEETMGEQCTLYAFDLHFHGQSPAYHHRVDEPFAPKEIAEFFTTFVDRLDVQRVALFGYSLGGRIALCLLEHMPERISYAFLVASDGLKTRPWYRGLASSHFGLRAYKGFVERPWAVHAAIGFLRATRLMSGRMHRFLKDRTNSRAKRQLVHHVWLSYRLIEPDLAKVGANVRKDGVLVHLFFGKRDRVIPSGLGWKLQRHAREQVRQHQLELGHRLLVPELGRAIAELMSGTDGGK